jgi:hypothetical protein
MTPKMVHNNKEFYRNIVKEGRPPKRSEELK